MTRNQTSKRTLHRSVGIAMLTVGSAVMVTYSAAVAWQFYAALNCAAADSLGLLGSLGLASLRAFHIAVFDHAALLSLVHRILLLCSALIVTLIGVALLKKPAIRTKAPGGRHLSARPKGDQ